MRQVAEVQYCHPMATKRLQFSQDEHDRLIDLFGVLSGRRVRVEVETEGSCMELRVEYVDCEWPLGYAGFDDDATQAAAWLIVTEIFCEVPTPPDHRQQVRIAQVLRHYLRTGRVTIKELGYICALPSTHALGHYLAQFRGRR